MSLYFSELKGKKEYELRQPLVQNWDCYAIFIESLLS